MYSKKFVDSRIGTSHIWVSSHCDKRHLYYARHQRFCRHEVFVSCAFSEGKNSDYWIDNSLLQYLFQRKILVICSENKNHLEVSYFIQAFQTDISTSFLQQRDRVQPGKVIQLIVLHRLYMTSFSFTRTCGTRSFRLPDLRGVI